VWFLAARRDRWSVEGDTIHVDQYSKERISVPIQDVDRICVHHFRITLEKFGKDFFYEIFFVDPEPAAAFLRHYQMTKYI